MKVTLFAFMENRYSSLRNIEKLCKTDIRYIWLLDGKKAPSFVTVSNFLRGYVGKNIEALFADINKYLFAEEGVDLSRLYIDGTKIEANANKYTWVWNKSYLKSRDKVYRQLTDLIGEINTGILSFFNVRIEPRKEYAIEYLDEVIRRLSSATGVNGEYICGRGHRKTVEHRQYDKLTECL